MSFARKRGALRLPWWGLLLLPAAAVLSGCPVYFGVPCAEQSCGPFECCAQSCGGVDANDACIAPSLVCPEIWAPVCGCDGITYGNACEAHGACVAIASEGECEVPLVCGGEVCAGGACCVASCGGLDATDACVVPPEACPLLYAPVCGCDGVTYGNECEAHASCVAVDYWGECGATCGGATCGPEACCARSCGGTDPADVCVAQPAACPAVWDPVCGCDGTTYSNACDAHAACVAIGHPGECASMCGYVTPEPDGCPEGTVDCPVAGPASSCVAPEDFRDCCCPLCL